MLSAGERQGMTIKVINRATQWTTLLCIFSVILAACSSASTTAIPSPGSTPTAATPVPSPGSTPISATPAYWPTTAWRTSSPEEQGMDSEKLEQMLVTIRQQQLKLHSLLVIRNGYLVSETYFGRFGQDTPHEIYSCTKSVVATLIGIAIDQASIDGTNHRIVDFFSDRTFANLDTQKQNMTLEDVLTMQAGLDWQEGDPAYRAMYRSPDWVKFMLDKPMAEPAGSRFNYCSGCSHVLSAVLEQTTDKNPGDFAEQYLFKPLGISNIQWDTDAAGLPIGGWGLQLTPRDMAKLGYLYLRNGQWEGRQIVSAEWVENATRRHTGTDSDLGYGYQWWTYPSLTAYTALGRSGQTIFVIPDADLIVVTTAEMDNHDEIFRLIEQFIVPAVQRSQ
jgi:CubicO group peptidase (beta-lactamase class C family)